MTIFHSSWVYGIIMRSVAGLGRALREKVGEVVEMEGVAVNVYEVE
jgi:hypothetical protein